MADRPPVIAHGGRTLYIVEVSKELFVNLHIVEESEEAAREVAEKEADKLSPHEWDQEPYEVRVTEERYELHKHHPVWYGGEWMLWPTAAQEWAEDDEVIKIHPDQGRLL